MLMLLTGLDMAFWQIEEMLAITKFGWGDNNGVDGVNFDTGLYLGIHIQAYSYICC